MAAGVMGAAAAAGGAPAVDGEHRQQRPFFLEIEAALGDGQAEGGGVKPEDRHKLMEEGYVRAVHAAGAGREGVSHNVADERMEVGREEERERLASATRSSA